MKGGRYSDGARPDQLPFWALQADLADAKNRLAAAMKRIEEGRPAYKRVANYERVLKRKVADIEREIKRRERRA